MKNRFWLLALIAISFTGCYTSFAPRDYEEDSYGQMDNYYYDSSDVAMNTDTSEFYYPEDEFYYGNPVQEVTVINNYGYDWGYSSPYSSRIYTSYGCYDPFYDPFYDPYCYPYYRPYYAYGYGSIYVGYSHGYGYYNYPSSVRYRANRSHWTSVRNNGGRHEVSRTRDANRGRSLEKDINTRDQYRTVKGFDLDRDLRVSKIASNSSSGRSSNKSGLRTAGYTRDGNSKSKAKRTTDLERRRISTKSKNNEAIGSSKSSKEQRTQRVSKRSKVSNNSKTASKRSKRVYSSKRVSKSNNASRTPSRTYYKPPSRSSSSSKVSKSSRSSSSKSSGYSSSRNTSRSSSSRSSVSRSSGSSSSRSSVSRSSGRSSSSSGSSSRSSSGSSSRRR